MHGPPPCWVEVRGSGRTPCGPSLSRHSGGVVPREFGDVIATAVRQLYHCVPDPTQAADLLMRQEADQRRFPAPARRVDQETARGVHSSTCPKGKELDRVGSEEDFKGAVEATRIALS